MPKNIAELKIQGDGTTTIHKKISNIKVVEFSFENCTVAIKYRASFKSERFPSYESH